MIKVEVDVQSEVDGSKVESTSTQRGSKLFYTRSLRDVR
jgi:hypothetical protein